VWVNYINGKAQKLEDIKDDILTPILELSLKPWNTLTDSAHKALILSELSFFLTSPTLRLLPSNLLNRYRDIYPMLPWLEYLIKDEAFFPKLAQLPAEEQALRTVSFTSNFLMLLSDLVPSTPVVFTVRILLLYHSLLLTKLNRAFI
jgi:hypothetical protein